MLLRFLIALLIATSAYAEGVSAPFGLKWGTSAAEVEATLGVAPEDEPLWGRVINFRSPRAPVTPPDTDFISVAVDPDFGMGRVLWASNDIKNDTYGTKGKEQFRELKAILIEKYGTPTLEMERAGLKLWKDRDEFYQCLNYDGCGLWHALWEVDNPTMSVGLRLHGLRRSEGYLSMVYEGPNWSQIIDAVNAAEVKAKQDAF